MQRLHDHLYKDALETLSEFVFIHTQSGELISLNTNFEKTLGISKKHLNELWLSQLLFIDQTGAQIPYTELPSFLTLKNKSHFNNYILGVRTPNDELKWLSIDSVPFRVSESEEPAALVTVFDLSDQKKLEQKVLREKEQAEKENQAKSDFLSKMSHELRTPLNGILGFAQLLEMDDTLNPQQQDYVREILNGGEHLLNLVNHILDLSRMENGQLKVLKKEVDCLTIINECLQTVKPLVQKKNLTIKKKWNNQAYPFVLADPLRLKQVILNLLDNAIKYNQDGGSITLSLHIENNKQVIHIVDSGIGISTEDYERIFVPFFRIDGNLIEGAGIGLALVKQLVLLMGGEIQVKSSKGMGSDFFFSLPLPAEHQVGVKLDTTLDDRRYPINWDDDHRLLIIEDHSPSLQLILKLFKDHPSFKLLTARTGKEGLKLAQANNVDLILLDLNLPDMHGYDVFHQLKSAKTTQAIPIVAVSANALPQDINQTLDLGFANYITKPINIRKFLMALNDTLYSTVNRDIPDYKILSTGPNGEPVVSAKTLQLSLKDLNKLQKKKYTAAISMHYAKHDWAGSIVEGLEATFAKMGMEVIAVTDAEFNAEKQVEDLNSILMKHPDLIVSIPVNADPLISIYQEAQKTGSQLLFMDNVPNGLKAGKDYLTLVSADNFGNGTEAAHIMADKLGGQGQIGIIYHDGDFFSMQQRKTAFEEIMKNDYPGIQIVARRGFKKPHEGKELTADLLTAHPQLDGIFVVWDFLAAGALTAAREAQRQDLIITTIDLGTPTALEMAKNGPIKGLGAQLPYQQGVAAAILAGYALLEKPVPPYVAVPALRVTRDNILDAWKLVYNKDAPDVIKKEY